MKLGTQSRCSSLIISMIWHANFKNGCLPAFNRIAISKNFDSHKSLMESFFKIKTFKILKEVMECFFNGNKSPKKMMVSFFSIKNFKNRKAVVEFFYSFKSFKSRKKLTESFFRGNASLSFHTMRKFPGTTFSLSVPSEFLWS